MPAFPVDIFLALNIQYYTYCNLFYLDKLLTLSTRTSRVQPQSLSYRRHFCNCWLGTTCYFIRCTVCIQHVKLRTGYAYQYRLFSYTTCGVGYVYDLSPIKTHTPKSNGPLLASVEPKAIEIIHTFTNLLFYML